MTFRKGESGNAAGRKAIVLRPAKLELIERLASRGCHEDTIAKHVGVSGPTWKRLRERDEHVAAAYARGHAAWHDFHVANMNAQAAKGQFAASAFILERKFGYVAGNGANESRPQITINLPGALPLAQFQAAAIEHETAPALPAPAKAKVKLTR